MSTGIQPSDDVSDGFEVSADTHSELGVGTTVSLTKVIDDADVASFALASADTNPLHLDTDYASETRFERPIAHGVLVAGVISAALARLPGVVVYLGQEMQFRAPVYVGDTVTADCTLVEALGGNRYRVETVVKADEQVVIDGEATILIDEEPAV
jgi:acyl dehydratase